MFTMQTRHSLLFLLGLTAALAGSLLLQVNAQDDPPLGEDLVRCRHCDDKGKMACRSCEGKGKLYKICTQCNGGGRRPCRQCNKPNAEEPNEAGPGKISCGYCGGDGKFGVRDKSIPGAELDQLTTALAPPPPPAPEDSSKPVIVKDDFDEGIRQAKARGDKLTLINFTGFT